MPRPIRRKTLPKTGDGDLKVITVKEVADEVESIRADLWAVGERLNKLSWILMTHEVNPGTAQETSNDIPF